MPLKNICSVRQQGISEKIETNLISYFDYGFIDKGGYFNVDLNQSGEYTPNLSSLTKVIDNRGFTYWAGPQNWVYESGADNSGVNTPAQIYVNNSPYSLATINYRDGYVYNIPSTGTSVKAQFSYKWVNFVSADKIYGFGKKITYNQNRVDLDPVARSGAEMQISLPYVSFEVPPISNQKAYGMGGGDFTPTIYTHNVKATIVSDNPNDVKRIGDIISGQQGYSISTYDPETVRASGDWPINLNGTINSGKTHSELADLYPWENIWIEKVTVEKGPKLGVNLFQSIARIEVKVVSCGCP